MFGLYFWVKLTPATNAVRVMSDIRFVIEERLAEAGISIPFPQRDLHLDATRPLKVEVVPSGAVEAEARVQLSATSAAMKHGAAP